MPIESSIPLHIRPVEMPDPLKAAGNALALRGQIQRGQMQQQEMQQNQLQLDKMRRDKDDDETLRKLYLENQGRLPDVVKAAAGRVSPERYKSLVQLELEDRTKRATLTNEENKVRESAADRLAGLLDGVRKAPKEQRAQRWTDAVGVATRDNLLKPLNLNPERIPQEAPDDTQLDFMMAGFLGEAAMSRRATEQARQEASKATARRADVETETAKITQEQKQLQLAGQKIGAATNLDEYRSAYGKLTVDEARRFGFHDPEGPDFNLDKAITHARNLSMTGAQQTTARHQGTIENLQRQRVELERARLDLQNKGSSADQRQAYSEISRLENQEDAINRQRLQLGQAIGAGDRYITPSGIAKPLKEAAAENNTTVDALIDDMRARYAATGPTLKRVIRDKYQQYGRLGVTASIPIADVNAAVDAGDQQTHTQHAARRLSRAQNKADYAKEWYGLDSSVARRFPHPDRWDEKTTPNKVKEIAGQVAPAEEGKPVAGGKPERKASVNNPGNIKVDDDNFRQYASPQEGWDDLRGDLAAKIAGKTKHGLNADSTILELAKVWAPKGDGKNKPEDWARNVATHLGVSVKTPIGNYAKRLDDLAQAVAVAEGSKVPFAPARAAASQQPGAAPAPQPQQQAAAGSPRIGQKFSNGKMTVRWDGKNYIDEATGKPAAF